MTSHSIALRDVFVCLVAAAPIAAQAQSTQPEIVACFDSRTSSTGTPQGSGVVYRIKVPGVVGQQGCVDPRHTRFSWTLRHGALTGLSNDDHPQYLLADGTRVLTGPLQTGGFKITGLAAGTAAGDAVRFEQAVKTGDPAGGDLGGSYPHPIVTKLQGQPVSSAAPASGQVLSFDGSAWAPVTPPTAGGGVLGYEIVEGFSETVAPGVHVVLFAECPAGKRAIGGGMRVDTSSQPTRIEETGPGFTGGPEPGRGWATKVTTEGPESHEVIPVAVCVNAP